MDEPIDSKPFTARFGRRDAFRIGGVGISLAALVAACGNDRDGDSAPGRVGYAPPVTALPDYPVDDSVYLRTSSSVEVTIVDVYKQFLSGDGLDDSATAVVQELVARHGELIDGFSALTEMAGGVPWTCSNPWMVERLIDPVMTTIALDDDPSRSLLDFAISLENLGAATHQSFTSALSDPELRTGTANAAAVDSRAAATLVVLTRGSDGYVSPAINGGEVPSVDGTPEQFAITSRFGSTAQFELTVGPADENGVRTSFLLNTPAENAYIYNELEPSC
jgi:hypothetical protein